MYKIFNYTHVKTYYIFIKKRNLLYQIVNSDYVFMYSHIKTYLNNDLLYKIGHSR